MRVVIASILEIGEDEISIKATTTEKLGFIGREEGIMAQAVVLLRKPD
jgi:2-C-methyl-D-erythritol 2,4-cyclodiphosphate synthase